ncbi:MAG: hypothetical protein ACOCUW_03590 [Gemmatimonadota bacterium]
MASGAVAGKIDGPDIGLPDITIRRRKAVHDRYRVDRNGRGTFDRVMRGWASLERHGVDVDILCTVHAAAGLLAEARSAAGIRQVLAAREPGAPGRR